MVQLQRRANRPGTRECPHFPERKTKNTLAKLEVEVRKTLGLTAPAAPVAVAAAAARQPERQGRVTTMPSAAPERQKYSG